MQNPEIQLCNSKMKCAAKTSYARNYDHPECSTRTKYNTTTYYTQKRAFINGVLNRFREYWGEVWTCMSV